MTKEKYEGENTKMKKAAAALAALLLLLAVSTAAAQTVTAMATVPYMETWASWACRARILGYDSETDTLDVQLVIPEIFSREDAESLQPGDGIYTEGREVQIVSVEVSEYGDILLNEGTENPVRLAEDLQGNYRTTDPVSADYYCQELARIELPVPEHLVLLDANDPEAGDLPRVYGAQEFIAQKTQDPEFCRDDVYVVLDGNGELAVIYRYYTPWG